MELYALDERFDVVTVGIPYASLSWVRRYYDFGQWSASIPLEKYDPSWAYVGLRGRPELGLVNKLTEVGEGAVSVTLGGFMCERLLNEKACYPRYIADVSHTEDAVRRIFAQYKADLPIELGEPNSPLLGDRTRSDFSDDQLGTKLYSVLESRELSYRVRYDYEGNRLLFEVWQGLDRTQSQDVNPLQTFSAEFGNILSKTIDVDDSNYKNYAIIPVNADDDGKERKTLYLDWTNGERRREIVFDMRSQKPESGQSDADFEAGIIQDASEKLLGYAKVLDVDATTVGGYLVDYDLGDRVDLLLSDVGIDMETRIVEVTESYTANGPSVTVGLGNKRITNVRRAVLR